MPAGVCIFTSPDVPVGSSQTYCPIKILKKKREKKCTPYYEQLCSLLLARAPERWEVVDLVRVYLALLIIAASGSSSGLGKEELPAGTDADLVETLSVSRNLFLAQGQVWHAHRLSIQHQLHSGDREE